MLEGKNGMKVKEERKQKRNKKVRDRSKGISGRKGKCGGNYGKRKREAI